MVTRGNTGCGYQIASLYFDSCYPNLDKRLKPVSSYISQAVRTRSHPCGCACGTRFRLRATLPQDSVASCSDLRQLFERSAQRKASFAAPQPEWRDTGLPGAKRRDADCRVVFFCLLCLHEQEKKVASRGETRPLSRAIKLLLFREWLSFDFS